MNVIASEYRALARTPPGRRRASGIAGQNRRALVDGEAGVPRAIEYFEGRGINLALQEKFSAGLSFRPFPFFRHKPDFDDDTSSQYNRLAL